MPRGMVEVQAEIIRRRSQYRSNDTGEREVDPLRED